MRLLVSTGPATSHLKMFSILNLNSSWANQGFLKMFVSQT